jgi:hypothetical protein
MIIGTGICGTILGLVVILGIGRDIVSTNPEFSSWFLPWTVFGILAAIPCYLTLIIGWSIADNIGNDRSFVMENAVKLARVSKLAAGDAMFFFIGNIILWLCGKNHPGMVIVSLFISFAGVVISVGMAVLSYHTRKAARLQEENDLTI